MMHQLKRVSVYLLPAILILVVTVLKLNFSEVLGAKAPYLLYTTVVVVSTWYSGWAIGIVTNAICSFLTFYYFLEPEVSLFTQPRLFIQLGMFTGQNLVVAYMGYTMKKALDRSKEAEARFKLLIEKASDVLVLRDKDNNVTYASPKITRIFGYLPHEYSLITPEQLLPVSFREYYQKNINEIKKTPNAHISLKMQFMHKSGTLGWLEGDVYNYLEQPGINAMVSHFREVTERVRLENQKDEFLSIASHELKTPLTSIKAFNQLMSRTQDADKLRSFMNKSADHILRLEKLINDLLDVTKINAGKMEYTLQPFDFKQMLKESIDSVQLTAPEHRIVLQSVPEIEYTGDRFRLEQVVNNFLTNAIKYSPQGQQVLVNCNVEQDSVVVSVQDFGIGIAQDHLDRLFDRYYRVDNTAMRFEGLGLGLFISSEILKRHGGDFWIESEQDKGSTFYFRLPLSAGKQTSSSVSSTSTSYQDEHITIRYNDVKEWIEVDWTGYQNLVSVQGGCLRMLEMLRANQCSKVLNDNRQVQGTWSEAAEWVGEVWFPMMEKAGLQKFAWIFSPSAFSQLSAKKSVEVMQGGVLTQFFTQIELAQQWLGENKQ